MGFLRAGAFNRRRIVQNIKHLILLTVIVFYIKLAFMISSYLYNEDGPGIYDAVEKYGLIPTILIYISLSATIYLSAPLSLLNILGLVISNPFSNQTNHGKINTDTPFICFRVVTKGTYPRLVADITQKNLETCHKVGLKNFKFEIVTDRALGLNTSNYVREIVVPNEYRTPNETLFKARALHYCLDQSINILSNDDWITHLDEETLLTESVIHGIIEFITKPDSAVGQGVITYGGCGVQHWVTTLLDGVRVTIDYGLFRLGLGYLHTPLFGFKGSFVVVKMQIEQKVGFDFGPKECIAEDLRFALTAWSYGYKFDFVKGVMKEKSTFSLSDYVKQRKRWFIGHFHVIWSGPLPAYCKVVVFIMNITNVLLWTNILNFIFSIACPVPVTKWQLQLFFLMTVNILFMLSFGNFMSLSRSQYSIFTRLALSFLSQFLVPVLGVLEAWGSLSGFFHRNNLTFHVVQKETLTEHNEKTGQLSRELNSFEQLA
ncbi:Glycosyl transferase group 2 [Mactra antiquata]